MKTSKWMLVLAGLLAVAGGACVKIEDRSSPMNAPVIPTYSSDEFQRDFGSLDLVEGWVRELGYLAILTPAGPEIHARWAQFNTPPRAILPELATAGFLKRYDFALDRLLARYTRFRDESGTVRDLEFRDRYAVTLQLVRDTLAEFKTRFNYTDGQITTEMLKWPGGPLDNGLAPDFYVGRLSQPMKLEIWNEELVNRMMTSGHQLVLQQGAYGPRAVNRAEIALKPFCSFMDAATPQSVTSGQSFVMDQTRETPSDNAVSGRSLQVIHNGPTRLFFLTCFRLNGSDAPWRVSELRNILRGVVRVNVTN